MDLVLQGLLRAVGESLTVSERLFTTLSGSFNSSEEVGRRVELL